MLDICCVGIVSAALGSVTPYVFHVVLEERHGGHVVVRIQQEPTEGLDAQGRASVFVFLLHSSLSFLLANGVIVSNFQDRCCGRDD